MICTLVLLEILFTPLAVPLVTAAVELRRIAFTTLDEETALQVIMAFRSHTPTGNIEIC